MPNWAKLAELDAQDKLPPEAAAAYRQVREAGFVPLEHLPYDRASLRPPSSFDADQQRAFYDIVQESQRQGVDPRLALAAARGESQFRHLTDGKITKSRKGALGIMQLMPDTAAQYKKDPNDYRQNIEGGIAKLKDVYHMFGGRPSFALAAYNAGEGSVQEHAGIPPYPETQGYVRNGLGFIGSFMRVAPAAAAAPAPARPAPAAPEAFPWTPPTPPQPMAPVPTAPRAQAPPTPSTRRALPALTGEVLGKLPDGRPIVRTANGGYSTHRVVQMEFDGKTYNVPTMYGGEAVSEDLAAQIMRHHNFVDPDTGKPIVGYATPRAAEQARQQEHAQIEQQAQPIVRQSAHRQAATPPAPPRDEFPWMAPTPQPTPAPAPPTPVLPAQAQTPTTPQFTMDPAAMAGFPSEAPGVAVSFAQGLRQAGATTVHEIGNVFQRLDDLKRRLHPEAPPEELGVSWVPAMRTLEQELQVDPTLLKDRDRFADHLFRAIGTATGKLPAYMAEQYLGGPVLGPAVWAAISTDPEKGYLAAAIEGVRTALLFKTLDMARALPPELRIPIVSTLFGGATALQGGSVEDSVIQGLIGAGLAIPGGDPNTARGRLGRKLDDFKAQPPPGGSAGPTPAPPRPSITLDDVIAATEEAHQATAPTVPLRGPRTPRLPVPEIPTPETPPTTTTSATTGAQVPTLTPLPGTQAAGQPPAVLTTELEPAPDADILSAIIAHTESQRPPTPEAPTPAPATPEPVPPATPPVPTDPVEGIIAKITQATAPTPPPQAPPAQETAPWQPPPTPTETPDVGRVSIDIEKPVPPVTPNVTPSAPAPTSEQELRNLTREELEQRFRDALAASQQPPPSAPVPPPSAAPAAVPAPAEPRQATETGVPGPAVVAPVAPPTTEAPAAPETLAQAKDRWMRERNFAVGDRIRGMSDRGIPIEGTITVDPRIGFIVQKDDGTRAPLFTNKIQWEKVAPEVPAAPPTGPAPATFLGWQEQLKGLPPLALWDLTSDIPGHPRESTVTTQTLREAGYTVEEPPQPAMGTQPPAAPESSPPEKPQRFEAGQLVTYQRNGETYTGRVLPNRYQSTNETVERVESVANPAGLGRIDTVRPTDMRLAQPEAPPAVEPPTPTPAPAETALIPAPTRTTAGVSRPTRKAGGEWFDVIFPEAPSVEVRKQLQNAGFRWHSGIRGWRARPTPARERLVAELLAPPAAAPAPPVPAERPTGAAPATHLVPPGMQMPLIRPTYADAIALLQQAGEARATVEQTEQGEVIDDAENALVQHLQEIRARIGQYLRELPIPTTPEEWRAVLDLQDWHTKLDVLARRVAGLRETPEDPPALRLAKRLALRLMNGTAPRTMIRLQIMADDIWGGTRGQGAYTPDDLYDAIEVALNLYVLHDDTTYFDPRAGLDRARDAIDRLDALRAGLPTKTARTEETDRYQQFSTPAAYAYAVNWVANLQPSDVVLEPSAGTGTLATFAARAVGVDQVDVNELAPRRVESLKGLGFPEVGTEDALYLHSIRTQHRDRQPTVVVMNPPFSSAVQQGRHNTEVGARHVEEALKLLAPGGRLVAIVGRGMAMDAATFVPWWKHIAQQYTVRANVLVDGNVFYKQGTSFATRVLVIDKGTPTADGTIVTGEVTTLDALVQMLEEVRNVRTRTEQPASTEPGGETLAGGREGAAGGPEPVRAPTDVVAPPGTSPTGAPPERSEGTRGGAVGDGEPGAGPTVSPAPARRPGRGRGSRGGRRPVGTRPVPVPEPTGSSGAAPEYPPGRFEQPSPDVAPAAPGNVTPQPWHPKADDLQALRDILGPAAPAVEEPSAPYGDTIAGVDLAKYAQLKPILVRMLTEAQDAGTGVEGFIQRLVVELGEPILPYLLQFHQDLQRPSEPALTPFVPYVPPVLTLPGAQPHPTPLVETATMAAVSGPRLTYVPQFATEVVTAGRLSAEQVEHVTRAGQAHAQTLPDGTRQGYFIGNGPGVGKGRTIAGIFADNVAQGRTKGVWISENDTTLFTAAQRDWGNVTHSTEKGDLFRLARVPVAEAVSVPRGIAFTSYAALRSGSRTDDTKTRLAQLIAWLGPTFDGVIVLDESHNLGNNTAEAGARGKSTPSAQALAGLALQDALPNARVVYVSATGATEVRNLGYAPRLGLWGAKTSFPTKQDFMNNMNAGGIAAMEYVARDLKALGLYNARSLSYEGIEYDRFVHDLTPEQTTAYNTMADAWLVVLEHLDQALEIVGATGAGSGPMRRNRLGAFWNANLAFFNQVLTSMQMPTVINRMDADVRRGDAVLVQLINTNEAAQERKLDSHDPDEDYEDVSLTPLDILMRYVEKAFPVWKLQDVTDDDGKVIGKSVVKDSQGNPVEDPEAVALREQLLTHLSTLYTVVPSSALEQLLNHIWTDADGKRVDGADMVAEVTGRKERLVYRLDDDGVRRRHLEKHGDAAARRDAEQFMQDKKQVLVYSEKGGTGVDYHASLTVPNQRKRRHYPIQPGWRADKMVQGLGRSHRTGQRSAPWYGLPSTNVPGHVRFMAAIARRLDTLGALTRGQQKSAQQGLFSERDNLEGRFASMALNALFRDIAAQRLELEPGQPYSIGAYEAASGLTLTDKRTGQFLGAPPLKQFLNRLLSMRMEVQQFLFGAFADRMDYLLEIAAQEGALNEGAGVLKGDHLHKIHDEVIATEPATGAETRYVQVRVQTRRIPVTWERLQNRLKGFSKVYGYGRNKQSGRVYAFVEAQPRTRENGDQVPMVRRLGTDGEELHEASEMSQQRYSVVPAEAMELQWTTEVAGLSPFREHTEHLLTGMLLKHWDKLDQAPSTVYRVHTDDGQAFVARVIPPRSLEGVLQNFGKTVPGKEGPPLPKTPQDALTQILAHNAQLRLSNGWILKPATIQGERRIELTGPDYPHINELQADGVLYERIQYKARWFLPTGEHAAETLRRVTEMRPIVEQQGGASQVEEDTAPYGTQEGRSPYGMLPGFYSRARQVVEQKMPAKAPAHVVLRILDPAKSGVKQDELRWSGIAAWLQGQPGAVTKQQVLDFLDAHQVAVQPMVRGERRTVEWKYRGGDEQTWSGEVGGGYTGYSITRLPNNRYILRAPGGTRDGFDSMAEAQRRGEEYIENSGANVTRTSYSQYTEPGAEPGSYREVLFTLQGQSATSPHRIDVGEAYQALRRGEHVVARGEVAGETMSVDITDPEDIQDYEDFDFYVEHAEQAEPYVSSHWPAVLNPVAHLRMNDRVDTEGRKVLFLEEIQSDYAREGREKGFAQTLTTLPEGYVLKARESFPEIAHDFFSAWQVMSPEGGPPIGRGNTQEEAISHALMVLNNRETGLPPAPFVTTGDWYQLPLKWALQYASTHGYDGVAWTTGRMQQERYNLTKVVDELRWIPPALDDQGMLRGLKDGTIIFEQAMPASRLPEFIGRENAEQLVAAPTQPGTYGIEDPYHRLFTKDLPVGGGWAVNLYDRMLPQFLNRYTKNWGSRIESTQIVTEQGDYPETTEYARVPFLPITPEMRQSILTEGQPLFEKGVPYATRPNTDTADNYRLAAESLDALSQTGAQPVSSLRRGVVARPGTPGAAGARVLYRRLPTDSYLDDLRRTSRAVFVGEQAPTVHDLARLGAATRDPRIEYLDIIAMKGDTVVGTWVVSSRLPASSQAFLTPRGPGKDTLTRHFYRLRRWMRSLGADGYYMKHNHPSTKTDPSEADKLLTYRFAQVYDTERTMSGLPGFRGHVVINHDEYSTIDAAGNVQTVYAQKYPGPDPFLPEVSRTMALLSPEDVVRYAHDLHVGDALVGLFRDSKGYVRSVQILPPALFTSPTFPDWVRGQGRALGAPDLFTYTESPTIAMQEAAQQWYAQGVLFDHLTPVLPALTQEDPAGYGRQTPHRPSPGYRAEEQPFLRTGTE